MARCESATYLMGPYPRAVGPRCRFESERLAMALDGRPIEVCYTHARAEKKKGITRAMKCKVCGTDHDAPMVEKHYFVADIGEVAADE